MSDITSIPARLMAGLTAAWTERVTDYSAANGWVLKYALRHPTLPPINITASASGSDFAISVSAATTAAWAPGTYSWVATVEKSGEKYQCGSGQIVINPDFAASENLDGRSLAQKTLVDLKIAFSKWNPTIKEYTINGRSMTYNTKAEILGAISFWEAEVNKEDVMAGRKKPMGRRIFSRI